MKCTDSSQLSVLICSWCLAIYSRSTTCTSSPCRPLSSYSIVLLKRSHKRLASRRNSRSYPIALSSSVTQRWEEVFSRQTGFHTACTLSKEFSLRCLDQMSGISLQAKPLQAISLRCHFQDGPQATERTLLPCLQIPSGGLSEASVLTMNRFGVSSPNLRLQSKISQSKLHRRSRHSKSSSLCKYSGLTDLSLHKVSL